MKHQLTTKYFPGINLKLNLQKHRTALLFISIFSLTGFMLPSSMALAAAGSSVSATSGTSGSTSSALTATQQKQHLTNIQTKGVTEINRRLNSLGTVLTKISSVTKLSSGDQTTLKGEVNTEISGLTTLKAQLETDTTLSSAIADAQSIISEYRVYALVLPKTWLVSLADSQQVTEGKLTTLAQNLQTRITADQQAGKTVTSLQTQLNDMTTQITNAQAISSNMEQTVIVLQPADYNSDQALLSGDLAKLKTATSDNQAAYKDAKSIISSLESL